MRYAISISAASNICPAVATRSFTLATVFPEAMAASYIDSCIYNPLKGAAKSKVISG
jgi:hypothetical protein